MVCNGGKAFDQARRVFVLQLMVLQQNQQGLKHRDGEHAVGEDRQQDMPDQTRFCLDGLQRACRRELRHQRGQNPERKQQDQQNFNGKADACQHRHNDHRDRNQAGGAEEIQA